MVMEQPQLRRALEPRAGGGRALAGAARRHPGGTPQVHILDAQQDALAAVDRASSACFALAVPSSSSRPRSWRCRLGVVVHAVSMEMPPLG